MDIDTGGFELGDTAKDKITGFAGTVVGITQWLTGCARLSLQPKVDKDGKVPEANAFDVVTLELVKAGPRHAVARATGGPRPEPQRRRDAHR